MKANQAGYAVVMMCRFLEVSTSGYYAYFNRPTSTSLRSREDVILLAEGLSTFEEKDPFVPPSLARHLWCSSYPS